MEEVYLSEIPEDVNIVEYLQKYVKNGNFRLVFVYDSDFSNTPRLRLFMEALLDMYTFDAKDKNRLILVSDELNNNAVEHGTGGCGENKTSIVIKTQGKKTFINIEVTDCGEGTATEMEKLKKEKDLIGFEKHHGIRGRGLFLITEKIADRLYFKDAEGGGLIVGIEKTL